MWCLGRLLPLIIGDVINEDDPYWDNYLLLLTIVDYCLAPVISRDWVGYLRMNIIGNFSNSIPCVDLHQRCIIWCTTLR